MDEGIDRTVCSQAPLLALPSGWQFLRAVVSAIGLLALFLVVYGGADYLTSLHRRRVRVDLPCEQSLPFIPELTLGYSSIYVMFAVIPFLLRSKRSLDRFVVQMIWTTVVAGLCFLAVPSQLAFEVPNVSGWYAGAFQWADHVNLTYNLLPSLHVAYAVLCATAVYRCDRKVGVFFHLWAAGIALSAWLTYQHHLADLIAGYTLAFAVSRYVKLAPKQHAADGSGNGPPFASRGG
ncbi:hypothetical protein FYK55_11330 [Roseiconus nitratireducens]|uniref:Inositolphosphotransferase Aur1/Ipt1 domain-containing protein n=1 Tax=Roseiconus nitratireducens TaxID=2605748 RepID=A0A5M6DEZ3_9BACT|nr:phosphatase PAP2 family protein [Roseiconus nitratireducens]KAA5543765.1 hypothetical protein FYK55_11330 [Roseiconus nitratireducens]